MTDQLPRTEADLARARIQAVRDQVASVVLGQDQAVAGLLIGLIARGHVLLEGVPGVAKTLLIRTLAASLSLTTRRIQFTADMMPGDVTGSLVYDNRSADFSFRPGPVFTQILLADEINRTPPKTQAALLEAMEERQVSADGVTRALPEPFLVAATQNPLEQEGTYPLPEAQLDRFLIKAILPIPPRAAEIEVVSRHAAGFDPRQLPIEPLAGAEDIDRAQQSVRSVAVAPEVVAYIVDLARATRALPSLAAGVSPRAATALLATGRAWAWLAGRDFVTPDDVKALASATWAHRLSLRPEAELEGTTIDSVLTSAIESVPVPR
ncbi:AAA family ATPase [Enemella evansiae]|uniref:AAA family ATPase n=1 Tax=Enemella evansiae TaxID=2016499 RepID=A0A255GBE4_9ACTN|nr:MoxR family ATPase [Enemella evansiae]PFG66084.1 MoxR-like ATPase [Propionibacteriaceae bacterium ES.041]OYO00225.1 AAA family ATPase [Enemella evansiae]OYO04706.1 AAA family ATPase [Enemella evansiae]OYO04909.1 AAA family ATPase [Enemella evansiae]OYO07696.1 AAA family ATPase [Enemella evansiae]